MIAEAGTISSVNIIVSYSPLECYVMGEWCIREFLCRATECIYSNGSIYINWIW